MFWFAQNIPRQAYRLLGASVHNLILVISKLFQMNAASSPCSPWRRENEEYQFIFLFFPIKVFHLLQQSHKSINIPGCDK